MKEACTLEVIVSIKLMFVPLKYIFVNSVLPLVLADANSCLFNPIQAGGHIVRAPPPPPTGFFPAVPKRFLVD